MPIENFERYTPRIHPDAFVHSGAWVIGEVEVAEHATVWPGAVLRGDHGAIRIGARTSIQDGTVAHATVEHSQTQVGEECTVGHRVILHGCRIGPRCLIGMGSILLDHVELGEECLVGAGSLLTSNKKFAPRSFILGSPARRIREVTAAEIEWIAFSCKSYRELADRHRRRAAL
jgi:carbonic anhydrase/acetyltransferase-like protein (isoleucine patch superfamily)